MHLARRPHGSGDAWVEGPDGRRYWGMFGAAGLLVAHPVAGILLQHRAEWSHFGGTWGLPGGARHEGESAADGALREANEEAGVPAAAVEPRFESVMDLGWWSYTTVVAAATEAFTPVIGDAESLELRWVPAAAVDHLPLHPGFAARWPSLRAALDIRPRLIVDAANVVGARPDGWWRDRVGATNRLLERLRILATTGVPAALLGLAHDRWRPVVALVVEGQAKAVADDGVVRVVRAPADGDGAIVELVHAGDGPATVVTADRDLARRVGGLGARVVPPSRLLALL
ncbi:NUDIX domain-containing protein [Specibacter cremeus]|uniref:NUDIX domain-containing protein n=1 Tax=Specibacter cremeus TaxID=1629051 RepID=UPI000F78957D|nr:NUDIX domain-containing protein [Specibacter cremeus]